MKFVWLGTLKTIAMSLPVRGAWIEIFRGGACASPSVVSLPVRGAWIEMTAGAYGTETMTVAPRAGSVD